jgi:hypothetical protein
MKNVASEITIHAFRRFAAGGLELTRFRGHIILCVQGVANAQSAELRN